MSQTVRSRMIYRATHQRLTPGGLNPDGHPVYGGWTILTTSLPVYVYEHDSKEAFSASQVVTINDVRAFVPKGTDIKATDRLTSLLFRNGEVFSSNIYRVESVILRRKSHIELTLRVVTGE